jgi:hypothetical protein
MKKMDSGEITCYLLTLQLVKAGYQITYDEVIEQVGIKQFLSVPKEDRNRYLQGKLSVDKLIPTYHWYDHYTITVTQEKQWFVEAVKIIQNNFKCSEAHATAEAGMLSLMQGLKIKGK